MLILKIMMQAKQYQLKVFTPTTKSTDWILILSQAAWTDPIFQKLCLGNNNHIYCILYLLATASG